MGSIPLTATRLPSSSRVLAPGGPLDLVRVGQRIRACAPLKKGAIVTNIYGFRSDSTLLVGSAALLVQHRPF